MAQYSYPLDLTNPYFPFLSRDKGRSVIGGEIGKAPAAEDRPGVVYCHNVMPTDHGFTSVGYDYTILPIGGLVEEPADSSEHTIVDVRTIHDYSGTSGTIYLAFGDTGTGYVLESGDVTWNEIGTIVTSDFDPELVTVGDVNGISYIYYSKVACFAYSAGALFEVTLTGLTPEDILGVVASSGYLIAYTGNALAWSSTTDPEDFTPSLVTGAGGGNVPGLAGPILFCTSNAQGILIYTEGNVIAGTYTGNSTFPFKFREVRNSKGGLSLDMTAYEANSADQFVYTKAGLQTVNSQEAQVVLPEVTDFLAGKVIENFNESTLEYEYTNLLQTMRKKLKFIASRYLVISYGNYYFTHAIVYDTALKRLGKLRLKHADVFEYIGEQLEISKETIALIKGDGEVVTVRFADKVIEVDGESSGVLVIGKMQATRTRLLTLLGAEVENITTGSTFELHTQAALNGVTFTTVQGTELATADNFKKFGFLSTAVNHSLVFLGKFNLASAQILYSIAGRR